MLLVRNIASQIFRTMSKHSAKRTKLEQSRQVFSKTKQCRNDAAALNCNRSGKVEVLATPIKSESDKKEYRVIRLENGLIACLISDLHSSVESKNDSPIQSESDEEETSGSEDERPSSPEDASSGQDTKSTSKKMSEKEEKMAAASLSIGVGSFSDPKNIQGLAHFLEHMVFMGSEKFPVENDFDSFLKKRGGSDNASTECEVTTFYLECQDRHLNEALDKFSQFFISPLLKRDAMQREREAIESEFQMALPSDSERREQLLLSMAPETHPVNTFTWGNLETLRDNVSDDILYESVHEFRKRHYSAHRMTLAVQARLSVEELQAMVITHFAAIPNNGEDAIQFKNLYSTEVFDNPEFQRMYYIKPVKDICQVSLTWPLPSLLNKYKSKPHEYVSWLLGHEGKGSLKSYLKKDVWVLDISCGNSESGVEFNTMYALFSINMVLTEEGYKNLQKVIDAVFSYIKLLKTVSPQERIFREIQQIAEMGFRYQKEREAAEFVEDLSEAMHFYPPEHYICGSDILMEYDPQGISEILSYLQPLKVNIMTSKTDLPDGIIYDKIEKWFKTQYTDKEIPSDWIQRWENIEIFDDLKLPEPNVYLTTDFNIIECDGNVPEYPQEIYKTPMMELWYRPDKIFKLPKAYYCFYFITPFALTSPLNAVLLDAYVKLLELILEEEAYPAQVADLSYSLASTEKGVMLKLHGFNQKLPLLLELILKNMKYFSKKLSLPVFQALKEKQSKYYYNHFLKASKLVSDVRLSVLTLGHWTAVDRHAASKLITYEMMLEFGNIFTKQLYVQVLIQGNILTEQAINVAKLLETVLESEPMLPNTAPEYRVRQIPLGEHWCRLQSFNKDDPNTTIINYYQCGLSSIREMCIVEILLMVIEEPLFDILRTKEQLGYHVFCSLRDTFGVLGYSITVNSQADKFSAHHIDQRIEVFMKEATKIISRMGLDEFNEVKNDLIKLKQCVDIHLQEEVSRNWSEIASGEYIFDRLKREVSDIQKITKEELVQWLSKHSLCGNKENLRKLSIQVVGSAKNTKNSNDVAKSKSCKVNNCKNNKKDYETVHRSFVYGAPVEYILSPLDCLEDLSPKVKKRVIESNTVINDIEGFKNSLFIFPISRIKYLK